MQESVSGILVLYNHSVEVNAPTIMEHVLAFEQYSEFPVWNVNTTFGYPKGLSSLDFDVIVLHYSLFGPPSYHLDEYFVQYLTRSRAYKVAFFQDEHHYCRPRFEFLNRFRVDCVYTLLEPAYWGDVYRRSTSVPKLVYTIPGYVSEELVALAARIDVADAHREIDIGYRGRTLPFYMGKGAQEKAEIGRQFIQRAQGHDLTLDIAVDETSRIYGDAWFTFLANCRAVLGVEAGVSIFDRDDAVRRECEQVLTETPDLSFETISEQVLDAWEDNIFYRTISPRHFEAAALRVCQILFEGRYSNILQPMVHYIPLKKDFSNFDQVIQRFQDHDLRHALTENAYRDLIASGRYSYKRFASEFDRELSKVGLRPVPEEGLAARVTRALDRDRRQREARVRVRAALRRPFPGKRFVKPVLKPALERYSRWRYRRWEKTLVSQVDH